LYFVTSTLPSVVATAQTASPALLPAQLGVDVVVAVRLSKAPQLVPLNSVAVSPPATSRATQTTLPAAKEVQLGADVICPPTVVRALHVVPLNFVSTSAPVVPMAAQNAFPDPSPVQLGADAMIPAMLFQPPQVLVVNSSTIIVSERPRAAQTTLLLASEAHDGSPITVVVPIDTKLLQLARAKGAIGRHMIKTSQLTINRRCIFPSCALCL
jgi:hypothetical protein